MERKHRVVIVGGGFAGLTAAQKLGNRPVDVTLIDRRNFHLFQPLLYQVATGGLSPANIAAPLRSVLRRYRNVMVLLGDVTRVDLANRRVLLDHFPVEYDTLILAAGARHFYFGNEDWEPLAPGLKTVEDATEIRRRVLMNFELAERTTDPEERRKLLTFVIVGAGATGVELAGAIAELSRHTLRGNFRVINPAEARVLLVEGADRVLPPYRPSLSEKAERALRRLGVEVLKGHRVEGVRPDGVRLHDGRGPREIQAHTVLWAAGVQASPLGRCLVEAGASLDRSGRVQVQADLSLPQMPSVFVIGDMAHCTDPEGKPLPGVAPVAMQQGRHVAHQILHRLRGEPTRVFRYKDKGSMAVIGRNAAVADLGWVSFDGRLAWLAWLFIHIMFLIGYQNRLLVMFQWGWNYLSRNRSARLITGGPHGSPDPERHLVDRAVGHVAGARP